MAWKLFVFKGWGAYGNGMILTKQANDTVRKLVYG